jgi:hypothetical protein
VVAVRRSVVAAGNSKRLELSRIRARGRGKVCYPIVHVKIAAQNACKGAGDA